MKKLILISIMLFFIMSCTDKGITSVELTGLEETLPAELKGLRIYSVSLGDGSNVKVATLKNQPFSVNYQVGKIRGTTIIIDNNIKDDERIIHAKQIISETDSIIVIRK